MRFFLVAALLVALNSTGCARRASSGSQATFSPGSPSRTGGLIVTPANGLIGRVVSVNAGAKFVVISFPLGRLPSLEQRMAVYHGSLKVGEIKITGPQRDDKIVADIVAGETTVGDEVRQQ